MCWQQMKTVCVGSICDLVYTIFFYWSYFRRFIIPQELQEYISPCFDKKEWVMSQVNRDFTTQAWRNRFLRLRPAPASTQRHGCPDSSVSVQSLEVGDARTAEQVQGETPSHSMPHIRVSSIKLFCRTISGKHIAKFQNRCTRHQRMRWGWRSMPWSAILGSLTGHNSQSQLLSPISPAEDGAGPAGPS